MPSRGEALSDLARLVEGRVVGTGDPLITDVSHDSRQVGAGVLFVAIVGFTSDGHDFAGDAVARGAAAVVVSRPVAVDVPQLMVPDTRTSLARLAAAVHGRPSHDLRVIGVTGTNGKTSVTYLLESIFRCAGRPTGLIGTVQTRIGQDPIPTLRTTPEASDYQRLLGLMRDRGVEVVCSEVSSHALELGRVDETRFAVAAFTNLSQDHLDFHHDMDTYFAAKARLFEPERSERAVITVDDEWGRKLSGLVTIPTMTVSLEADADIVASILEADLSGTTFELSMPEYPAVRVRLRRAGPFNVANAAVAAGCALALGDVSIEDIAGGLESAPSTPGRFEIVSEQDDPFTVVVDYAHTPAGMEGVIDAVRRISAGRIIVVFGAGGDRDSMKRPLMGGAASRGDLVIVTSDNPRSEDPDAIIDDVMRGIEETEAIRQPDRALAIHEAIESAGEGDVVLVLGKGHERGQEISGRVLPFDDRLIARTELARRRERHP